MGGADVTPEEPGTLPPEEEFSLWLAACDERLAAGDPVGSPDELGAPAALRERLEREAAWCQLVRRMWPHAAHSNLDQTSYQLSVPPWTPAPAPAGLGRFAIRRELGRGAFGVVYLAYDPRLRRELALKVPRAEVLLTPELRRRFQHEAMAAAGLDHPNILPVYEAGEEGSVCFIASAYCPGITLAAWLRQRSGPVPYRVAAGLVATLAEAVEHAHRRGVLHRDLKPSNVLLETPAPGTLGGDGSELVPRITDFGLAKLVDEGPGASDAASPTLSGVILGTPSYMAPEQAEGHSGAVGPAADIYSLGVILYEGLTGRPPFQEDSALETLVLVRTQDPLPPSRLRPRLPRDLETICLKCLHKDPAARYGTAALLAEDLGRYLRNEPILARPVGQLERFRRWCRRNPVIAGLTATVFGLLVAVAMGATVAAVRLNHVAAEAETARQREAGERRKAETALTDMYTAYGLTTGSQGDPARAVLWFANAARQDHDPDRRHASRVRVRSWGRQVPTPVAALPHAGQALNDIAFHPAGQHLLTVTGRGRFFIWDLAREQPLDWAGGDMEVACAAWTPDGCSVVMATARGAVEIRAFPSGEVRQRLSLGRPVGALAVSRSGRFLALGGQGARVWDLTRPNCLASELPHPGRVVALTFNQREDRLATAGDDQLARVFAIPARPGKPEPLFSPVPHQQCNYLGVRPVKPAFVDQGRGLITVTAKDRAGWWDAETGSVVDTVLFRNEAGHPGEVFLVSANVDGSFFVVAGFSGVQIWDARTGKRAGKFLAHQNYVTSVAFNPDGRTLVTGGEDRRAGLWSLASGEAAASPLMHQASLGLVAYSPDGRVVATAQSDGLVRVWAPPRGNPRNHYMHYDVALTSARLSSDGRFVLATGAGWWPNTFRSTRVYEVATGRPASPLLEVGGLITDAALSPDGRQVATLCSLAGTREERYAYKLDPEGKAGRLQIWSRQTGQPMLHPLPLPAEPRGVAYSPDGTLLAAICTGGQIAFVDPATGKVIRRLEHGNFVRGDNTWPSVRFTRDGANFLTWGCNSTVRVWETATGQPRYAPLLHQECCYDPVISADGRMLVTCSRDNTARVWDFQTGQPLSEPLRHPEWVFSACFSRDGDYVLTGCRDGAALLWDWRTGQIVRTFQHRDAVFSAAFTPDERWVVTASRDRTACVWDRQTGRPVTPFLPFRGDVWCGLVTPDGQYAVLAGAAPNVLAWSLDDLGTENEMPVDDLCLLAEVLSGNQLQTGSDTGLTTEAWLVRWRALRAKYPDYGRVDPADSAAWHRCLAQEYAADGDPRAALWHLDRLMEAAPADAELRSFRGRIFAQLDRWREAAADYSEVTAREPENWDARLQRGNALLMEKNYAAAIADFSAALRIDRRHPMVLALRAWAYFKEGQHEKAVADCDEALNLDPILAPAYYARGLAHKGLGQVQEGELDHRRAITLDARFGK
jgi:WD40 repeat protein